MSVTWECDYRPWLAATRRFIPFPRCFRVSQTTINDELDAWSAFLTVAFQSERVWGGGCEKTFMENVFQAIIMHNELMKNRDSCEARREIEWNYTIVNILTLCSNEERIPVIANAVLDVSWRAQIPLQCNPLYIHHDTSTTLMLGLRLSRRNKVITA